jgi:hypothetical protein
VGQWEPITGAQQRVSVPAAFAMNPSAAVFCAADRCDHGYCLGGPFRVVAVEFVTSARRKLARVASRHSSVLVGNSLIYFLSDGEAIQVQPYCIPLT